MSSEELDFDSALLKKVTDAYAAKFKVFCGQGCNEVVEEVVRLIGASGAPTAVAAPVAWRMRTGDFWTFREDVPQIRDVYERNGWQALCVAPVWTPAAQPPDADTTVMLAFSDGEVWQGYFDGNTWLDVSGMPLADGRVTHWMHTPTHPEDRA